MEKVSPYRTALFYGLLSGILLFVFFILIYFMGKNPLGNWTWISFWVPILFMVLGIKAHRDNELGGFVGYGRAFVVSFLVALSGGVVYSIFGYIFGLTIGTDIVAMAVNESLDAMEKAKAFMGEDMYEKAMVALEEMKNNPQRALAQLVFGTLIWKAIGGLFLSLIVAAFMKKDKPMFENQM